MNALNVTTDDVAQALREQNVQGRQARSARRRCLTASSRP
jgi:multidrug efflux pump subunit AcrB